MKRRVPLTSLAAIVALGVACSSGSDPNASLVADSGEDTSAVAATSSVPGRSSATGAAVDFPTGPAVLVAQDYTPRKDRIDNTGAYLPANGKPTLVFVEAIW